VPGLEGEGLCCLGGHHADYAIAGVAIAVAAAFGGSERNAGCKWKADGRCHE
jgi:hypothetical protein